MKDKYTVFLVDDDFIFLEMMKEALSENEHLNIVAFQSGEECLNNLHLNPDFVVLDYYLDSENEEAKNGMQVLQEITSKLPEIKVIILSGQEDGHLVYKFIMENAADYIVKDNDAFENVRKCLKELIDEH